jgi:hypothetical protein
VHAVLQQAEVGAAVAVEGDQFAVDDHALFDLAVMAAMSWRPRTGSALGCSGATGAKRVLHGAGPVEHGLGLKQVPDPPAGERTRFAVVLAEDHETHWHVQPSLRPADSRACSPLLWAIRCPTGRGRAGVNLW